MTRTRNRPRLLFVNPWIHDFAAHDLWARPLGLLYLAEYLAASGFELDIVDLLDRFHPDWHNEPRDRRRDTEYGTGKFHKHEIQKPSCLRNVRRRFSRYGAPVERATALLESLDPPDVILLTSSMTYWYTGVKETADLLRRCFPEAELVLGGTYATLLPEHARTTIRPDRLITGPGETPLLKLLGERLGETLPENPPVGSLRRVWKAYPSLESYPLLTSRGCPFRCSFCATHLLSPGFTQSDPKTVSDEIRYASTELGQTQFVFFDDALFVRPDRHIKPILKEAAGLGRDLGFHSPNGLMARFIDPELAELMASARFVRPRLSLETVSAERGKDIDHKVTRNQYVAALDCLHNAGYRPGESITYLIMGLPGQTVEEVRRAVDFVFSSGSSVSLAAFSPIPGTVEFDRTGLPPDIDPLLLNNTVHTLNVDPDQAARQDALALDVKKRNERLRTD